MINLLVAEQYGQYVLEATKTGLDLINSSTCEIVCCDICLGVVVRYLLSTENNLNAIKSRRVTRKRFICRGYLRNEQVQRHPLRKPARLHSSPSVPPQPFSKYLFLTFPLRAKLLSGLPVILGHRPQFRFPGIWRFSRHNL